MSQTVRTFIAMTLNPVIRQALSQIQIRLKESDCPVKWVDPKNIHLTLKFLGDVPLNKIDSIRQTLDGLFKGKGPVDIELERLGAFPDMTRPRILWAGLKDNEGRIAGMVLDLENALGQAGFKKEAKPFHAHITIGRTHSPKNIQQLSEALSGITLPNDLKYSARRITLFKSTLTPHGPIYESLHETELS